MKIQPNLQGGGARSTMANFPWYVIYPFFLVHMLGFGSSGFSMAYGDRNPDVAFLVMHGGIAIFVYIKFYIFIFGKEEVKWMLINAGLGVLGIYSQMGWILRLVFNREMADYPLYLHVIPFIYFVLYTFLLRQFLLKISGARRDAHRKVLIDRIYIAISLAIYVGTLALTL